MARTAAGAALTQQHRGAQLAVRAAALRDVSRLWSGVDPANLSGTIGRFADGASALVQARRAQSTAVAGTYFDQFRTVEQIPGRAPARVVARLATEAAVAALRGAGLAGIINARRAGFSPQAAARNGLVRVAGTATSLVLGGGRSTIVGMVGEDPRALGWQRVTSGSPCAFCAMIASRGAVFKEDTADFEAHDHDACTAEPYYDGSRPLPANEALRERWDQVTAGLSGTDALNAFRQALAGA